MNSYVLATDSPKRKIFTICYENVLATYISTLISIFIQFVLNTWDENATVFGNCCFNIPIVKLFNELK